MMLRHIGEKRAADALHIGLYETLQEGAHLTADLGGGSSTTQFAGRVAEFVKRYMKQ
jgi:isocitrate/isopropylmalate dehydrogenase